MHPTRLNVNFMLYPLSLDKVGEDGRSMVKAGVGKDSGTITNNDKDQAMDKKGNSGATAQIGKLRQQSRLALEEP